MTPKKKPKKFNYKKLIWLLVIILIIASFGYYLFNLKIKKIVIAGTNLIKDNEIIQKAQIMDYPLIYRLNLSKMAKRIETIDLVANVKIKRNIFGELKINIEENRVLFFNQSQNTIVLSNQKEVPDQNNYLGVPILINYVPDKIYQDLIEGLIQVSSDVLSQVSEIEYTPSKNEQGLVLDEARFLLTMNDGNVIYINTINILRLNKYLEIFASLENRKGTIQLDSSNSEVVSFIPFTTDEVIVVPEQ